MGWHCYYNTNTHTITPSIKPHPSHTKHTSITKNINPANVQDRPPMPPPPPPLPFFLEASLLRSLRSLRMETSLMLCWMSLIFFLTSPNTPLADFCTAASWVSEGCGLQLMRVKWSQIMRGVALNNEGPPTDR